MTFEKIHWLGEHLRCSVCFSAPLARADDAWKCYGCGATFEDVAHSSNFISDEMMIDFNIIENLKASDHPYNPTAVELIAKVEQIGGMVLDCGAGSRTFTSEHLIQTEIMPYANVDILAVNQSLPFVDNAFDVIFSFDVLEHVTDPFVSARELARVLKPGGLLYVDLPFLQLEHGYPHHYFNATRMGLRQLFADILKVEAHVVPESGHPTHLLWTALNTYRNGLPKDDRAGFENLTIGEILAAPWKDLRGSRFGKAISSEAKWKMASATQAMFAKESTGDDDATALSVEISNLPNFRNRESFMG